MASPFAYPCERPTTRSIRPNSDGHSITVNPRRSATADRTSDLQFSTQAPAFVYSLPIL
jgi:hypothetical protein